jgi:catechol 2,3-dioxygenase-like lactoylglutathione lyase family enzyme
VTAPDQYASVRYLVDDVQAAIDFYTTHPVRPASDRRGGWSPMLGSLRLGAG